MLHRTLLKKFNLCFADPVQEKEYLGLKIPLLQRFFTYLLLSVVVMLVPLSVHFFFIAHTPQQGIMTITMLSIAILLYLLRKWLGRWMEYLVVGYLLAVVGIIIFNLYFIFLSFSLCEAFYAGYAFALLHRILGYRVVQLHTMIIFHVLSLAARLIIFYDHRITVSLMITALEVLTVNLSIQSERGERGLFDTLYKSKHQLIKFKDFITEHLPHQMIIFSKDYSCVHLMNKAFRNCFQCDDLYQIKVSLKALVVEKEAIAKNMSLFARLGHIPDSKAEPLNLSQFMFLLVKHLDLIRGGEALTFQVYEDDNIAGNPCTVSPQSKDSSDDDGDIFTPKGNKSGKKGKLAKRGSLVLSENPSSPIDRFGSYTDRLVKKNPFEGNSEVDLEESVDAQPTPNDNGKARIFKVKIFLLQWDGDEVIGVMLDDISQQRTVMELKMSNKNKDLVVAMASHELRTPLNGMLGLLDIAKKNITDENVLPYLNACKNNGLFLLNLVNSILDLSQIRAKKLKLCYSKVNVKEMLTEISSLFESFTRVKRIYLKMNISPDVPETIMTDKSRLTQIIINLVGNAFKFTSEGGITVKVEMEKQDRCKLKFSVQDTGLGIPKEDLGKLFKLFGKLEHQDNKVNSNGVGLGLTISNTLAMLLNPHEGKGISVESEPGKGSTFSFEVLSRNQDTIIEKPVQDASLRDILAVMSDDDEEGGLESKAAPYIKDNFKLFFKAKSDENKFRRGQTIGLKTPSSDFKSCTVLLKPKEPAPEQKEAPNTPWCLIVDDNPFNLMVGRYVMEEKGYMVKTALNGKDAIEQVQEHEKSRKVFRVILMDCQMPVMDGYGVTRTLRKMMKNGEVTKCPVVALTANKGDGDLEKKCRDAGMIGCITKPLQVSELDEVLEKVNKQ